ncbi:MAG: IPT/TIG domain-containing protein [Thermoanaerobaculia bacterium]
MKASTQFRSSLLALGVLLFAGCSADKPSSPTAPPTTPIPPAVGISVSVTSSTSTLEVDGTNPAILTIRAIRADNGQPVANLSQATVTTTLGALGNINGPQTIQLELINGQATVPFFPGATVGTASIRASVSNGVGFTAVTVREPSTPDTFFLSSISPNTGSPQGGETVTIHGGGFENPIRVIFNGVAATILSHSTTEIRVTTPPLLTQLPTGGTQPVNVTVTVHLNEADQASDTLTGAFIYLNGSGGGGILQPSIFSITPSSGPNEGGTQVTINGDGFEAPVAVDFGDPGNEVAAQVISVSRTRVVALSPPASGIGAPNLNGLVDVRVTNQSSGRTNRAINAFRYGASVDITAISPTEGPAAGGTLVTIFGHGFDEPVAVTMARHGQQVVSVSGSEIVVRTVAIVTTGCADVSDATSVVNIETGDTNSRPGPNFTYRVPHPLIFSVSPGSGPQAGSTLVTISGANFGLPMLVDFEIGNTPFTGNVQSSTSSSISVRTPAVPNTVFTEQDCDDNGTPPVTVPPTANPVGKRYLAVAADVTITDPSSGCTVTSTGAFLFNPTDTSCRGD